MEVEEVIGGINGNAKKIIKNKLRKRINIMLPSSLLFH